jgi:hypothetical protein
LSYQLISNDEQSLHAQEFATFARLAADNPEFVVHVITPHQHGYEAGAEAAAELAGIKVQTRVTTSDTQDHFGAVFQA